MNNSTRNLMPRIHVVDSGETAHDISASKLQSSLAESPDCVLVPGSSQTLFSRFNELALFSCRGGGNGFEGEHATFRGLVCIRSVEVCGLSLVRLGRGNGSRFDTTIPLEDMENAVKGSGLLQKPKETPEDSCCLKLAMPLETATILQDLKVLPQLRRVSIQPKNYNLLLNKNWKMGCTVLNTTLQELLEELKTLPDTYNEDALMLKTADMGQHRLSMDHAKRIRALIPDIVRETHRTISTLIAQLSPCVQECLRAGLPIQTIEDALDSKLQEANYAFSNNVK
jgi:hypothetical protein